MAEILVYSKYDIITEPDGSNPEQITANWYYNTTLRTKRVEILHHRNSPESIPDPGTVIHTHSDGTTVTYDPTAPGHIRIT